MENNIDYIIHGYGFLTGTIGKKGNIAYVSIGNNVAAIGCYADSGRLDRRDVRQLVPNTGWHQVYVPTINSGYNYDNVAECIIKNIEVLEDLNLVADYVRCKGNFMPIVKIGYSAVPDYGMSGIGYYIVPDYVIDWTREFLASKK